MHFAFEGRCIARFSFLVHLGNNRVVIIRVRFARLNPHHISTHFLVDDFCDSLRLQIRVNGGPTIERFVLRTM